MAAFYTNVSRQSNNLLVRGVDENGHRFTRKVKYKPYLFIPQQGPVEGEYRTIEGKPVGKMDFDSMSEAREFLKQYDDVSGMEIYGLTDFTYLYINDRYRKQISYDPALIISVGIDIEVSSEGGFPDIASADKEVTAITLSHKGHKYVYGLPPGTCLDYVPHGPNITYYSCKTEQELLFKFLQKWEQLNPDVVTGWNIEFFDIPYLVNRITRVCTPEDAKRLSPWKMLREYDVEMRGKKQQAYTPVGVNVLDYINLYKKFTYTQQESYRLDHIAFIELGERKLDFSEYSNLEELYKQNYQKFIEYNIKDVELIDRLEDKMKLIELVYAMAFDAKVNFEDTLGSVKQWDVIIHNELMKTKTVIPHFKKHKGDYTIVGGYVKEPRTGLSKWVISLDLNSLYPHLIMQYNISPEKFVHWDTEFPSIDELLTGKCPAPRDYSYAANGTAYLRDGPGFLPALMYKMYIDRTVYQKELKELKKQYNETKDESLLKRIAALDNLQKAKKIQLNSAYGALGNEWFRWFDPKFAEAITMSGQLSIRWIEKKLNQYLNKIMQTTLVDYCIASDTDSVYLTLDALVNKVMPDQKDEVKIVKFIDQLTKEKLEPYIDKCYEELREYMNAMEQKMKMKREAIANKAIWKAKKMYILNVWDLEGVLYDKPKLKMMGIEAVKSSTPAACRTNLKKSFEIIMNETEEDLHKFIAEFRETFKTLPFDEVAFPRGVKNIEKWETKTGFASGTPIQVKAALAYNSILDKKKLAGKYEKIMSGSKIKFAYMKMPNPYQTAVLGCSSAMPPEFGLEKYIDYDTQFDKSYIEPLKSVISTIGWNTEKVATLEDFFA